MAKLSAKDEEFLLMADNRLDRRLIEGILTDRDATIQEIREKDDVTEAGVLRRASDLGQVMGRLRQGRLILFGRVVVSKSCPDKQPLQYRLQYNKINFPEAYR